MSDFSPWAQGNWYALSTVLAQLAFLVAGIWFARNLLKALRAFHEQFGALLKMTITTPAERSITNSSAKNPLASSPYWLMPSDQQPATVSEPAERRPGLLAAALHGMVLWLNTPMHHAEVNPWRRVMNWLQAPAGSH